MRFVQDDKTVVQSTTTHKCKWGNFDNLLLQICLCGFCTNHVVQSVIQRTQIRVDLCGEVARQKPQTLACFHSGARQDNSLYTFRVERQHSHRYSKPALSCACRTYAKCDDVVPNCFYVFALTRCLRTNVLSATGAQNVFCQNQAWLLICLHHHD